MSSVPSSRLFTSGVVLAVRGREDPKQGVFVVNSVTPIGAAPQKTVSLLAADRWVAFRPSEKYIFFVTFERQLKDRYIQIIETMKIDYLGLFFVSSLANRPPLALQCFLQTIFQSLKVALYHVNVRRNIIELSNVGIKSNCNRDPVEFLLLSLKIASK